MKTDARLRLSLICSLSLTKQTLMATIKTQDKLPPVIPPQCRNALSDVKRHGLFSSFNSKIAHRPALLSP
ncbi:hypothetical protein EB241_20440 [Erwinia psidii]|uniref:Uncharacterized protein n=1 Tax=Erwinia psidii TaxID=69224 RepID=A0A3N6S8I0_9GAMM|nr:hypothetical protein EB241_20440 [Erwinia psidii]